MAACTDQIAREQAQMALSEIRAHAQSCAASDRQRELREQDFMNHTRRTLQAMQHAYEEGQQRMEVTIADSLAAIRDDHKEHEQKDDRREEKNDHRFNSLYNRFWTLAIGLDTVLLSVIAYLIAHKGL